VRALLLALLVLAPGCFILRPTPRPPEPQLQPSGLVIWELQETDGPKAALGDTVLIHYEIMLLDGTQVDSSMDQGAPIEVVLGETEVVAGITEGLLGMGASARRKLQIPPDLGWGDQPVGPIPGGSTILAEVEIVELTKGDMAVGAQ